MSYVEEQQKRLMLEKLNEDSKLLIKEIEDIVHACQVASGNATGVGRIKGILEFIKVNTITIEQPSGTQKINDKHQLAKLLKSLDQYLDIETDRDFKAYF